MKILFFDDEKCFVRENLKRSLGKAELIPDSVYQDGISTTALNTGWVFPWGDGFRLLYVGRCEDELCHLFCAESRDGIHFTPEDVTAVFEKPDAVAKNDLMNLKPGQEIADILEDPQADASQRYKMLFTDLHTEEMYVYDRLLVSSDLLHWRSAM